jgi:hypothetical protein
MPRGKTDYETMTVDELHEVARRKGISGTSHMRKAELIETLRGESVEHGAHEKTATKAPSRERAAHDAEPQGESRTVKYAQHVTSPDEHEDRAGRTLITRDHDVIQQWAEERGAQPATIAGSRHDDHPGVLRFNFPGYGEGGNLEEISWDDWFKAFDERNLNFIYQEHTTAGKVSNFFRLENPDREDA